MTKKIIKALVIILIAILQISFFSILKFPYFNINLILSLVIFFAVIVDYQKAMFVGLATGLLLELYSPLFFGVIVLSLLLTTIVINSLFVHLFTNRTFFSLLSLTLVGVVAYNVIILLLSNVTFYLNNALYHFVLDYRYFLNLLWQIIFTFFLIILYYAGYYIVKRYILNLDMIKTA